MTIRQIALPPNSVLGDHLINSFTRTGEHGNIIIQNILSTDTFMGDSPSYQWQKYDDGSILGPPTIIQSNGELHLFGRSTSSGVYRYLWTTSQDLLMFMPGTDIDVHLRLPAHSSTSDFFWRFVIHPMKTAGTLPTSEWEHLRVELATTTTTYYAGAVKRVGGATTVISLDDAGDPNLVPIPVAEGTFRIKVHRDGEISMFFHEGSGDVDEAADLFVEKQFLGLGWDRGYASFEYATGDTTNRTMDSNGLWIHYPSFRGLFKAPIDGKQNGDVELWDGDPATTGVRVYGHDHKFSGDVFVQNGVMRFRLNIGDSTGFRHLYWSGSAWVEPNNSSLYHQLAGVPKDVHYPFMREIVQNSRDVVTLKVRLTDTSVDNEDYWVDVLYTLRRGMRGVIVNPIAMNPIDELITYGTDYASQHRFGYVTGPLGLSTPMLADDDLNTVASTGTDMRDNWNCSFDNDQEQVICILATNLKPSSSPENQCWEGGLYVWRKFSPDQLRDVKFLIGWTPFAKIANLFREAEYCLDQGWHVGGVKNTTDGDDSGDNVMLGSQFDEVFYLFTAGTDLPEGRYLALVRVKQTSAVGNDLWLYVVNTTDAVNRNEENATVILNATTSYRIYGIFFDITAEDVTDTDVFKLSAGKATTGIQDLKIDLFCIVPYSNGREWSQDLAHIFLRHHNQSYHVDPRIN